MIEDINKNIQNIEDKIRIAASKSGRDLSDITLLAASKTRSTDEIIAALNGGITALGENYVQEFLPKYEALALKGYKNISWHLIGHLQKNKVKYIIGKVDLIHSVDGVELAAVIDKQSRDYGTVSDILIELNIAGENTKNGIKIDAAVATVEALNRFNFIKVKGLMAMPPLANEPEENRKYFKALKELLSDINRKDIYKYELDSLSMGTSSDFEAAIEEGATIVRIGTVLFGNRPPKIKIKF